MFFANFPCLHRNGRLPVDFRMGLSFDELKGLKRYTIWLWFHVSSTFLLGARGLNVCILYLGGARGQFLFFWVNFCIILNFSPDLMNL